MPVPRWMIFLRGSMLSPIAKEALRREWRKKAQFAALNGMPPQERLKVLGAGPLDKSVSDRTSEAMSFFTSQGWTKEQAAGIVGNLIGESKLDPGARNPGDGNDGSDSIGIGQWNGARARALKAYAGERGLDWQDFGTQLAFVQHELQTSESAAARALRGAATVDEATAAFVGYERPAGWSAANPRAAHNFSGRLRFASQAAGEPITAHPTGEVDPRFADLNYADWEKLTSGAAKEIDQQEIEQEALATARYKINDDALTLGIENGSVTNEAEILNSGLDDGDIAKHLKAFRAKVKEDADVRALISAVSESDGGIAINPFDTSQTSVADKAYTKIVSSVSPDQQNAATLGWIESTKYIPKPVQALLRQGVASVDAAELGQALSLSDALQKIAPMSFDDFEGGSDVRDKLAVYRHLVNDRGMSSEDAAAKMLAMNDPANKVNREVLKEQATKFIKSLTVSEVTNAFDPGALAWEPEAGLMPSQQNALLADYREAAEERFYETGDEGTTIEHRELNKTRGIVFVGNEVEASSTGWATYFNEVKDCAFNTAYKHIEMIAGDGGDGMGGGTSEPNANHSRDCLFERYIIAIDLTTIEESQHTGHFFQAAPGVAGINGGFTDAIKLNGFGHLLIFSGEAGDGSRGYNLGAASQSNTVIVQSNFAAGNVDSAVAGANTIIDRGRITANRLTMRGGLDLRAVGSGALPSSPRSYESYIVTNPSTGGARPFFWDPVSSVWRDFSGATGGV